MKWVVNNNKNLKAKKTLLDASTLFEAKSFHESFPAYEPTPLVRLKNMASYLGVSEIFVKDESFRFGLNAFKVLGASFAIGKYLARKLDKNITEIPFSVLVSDEMKETIKGITLCTTTDGNHGRGVAWMAQQLGCKAVVYMPKGSTQNRVDNIAMFGAEVSVTEWNYDETVRFTAEQAEKYGWEIIQDTSWDGYLDVPTWIIQGYSTVAQEAIEQLKGVRPTHVFVQAGVGAFASVIANIFATLFEKNPPKIVVCEPDQADCYYRSFMENKVVAVTGEMRTIMAGLACGEPNPMSWDILKDYTHMSISAPDWVAARGMRILGNPLKGDTKVVSGESGAIGAGILSVVTIDERYKELKEALELDENSRILLFSTEGNTDTDVYRRIVWDGDYQSLL